MAASICVFLPDEADLLPQYFVRVIVQRIFVFVQELLQLFVCAQCSVVALLKTFLQQETPIHNHHDIVPEGQPCWVFPHTYLSVIVFVEGEGVVEDLCEGEFWVGLFCDLLFVFFAVFVGHFPEFFLPQPGILPLINDPTFVYFCLDFFHQQQKPSRKNYNLFFFSRLTFLQSNDIFIDEPAVVEKIDALFEGNLS